MHELSHGDKPSQKRFEFIGIMLFMTSAILFFMQQHKMAYALWIFSAFYAIYINSSPKNEFEPKNERKNERKTEFIPAYGVDRTRMLVMLRNIESNKRNNV